MQQVPKQNELLAVAVPCDSQLPLPAADDVEPAAVQTAVADLALAVPAVADALEPAPVEESATELEQAVGLEPGVNTDMAEVPDCPKEAALITMKAPAPVLPLHVDPQGFAKPTADAVTAVAAQHTIQATLLGLARDIRRPKAYVGYSAFLLMALLKKCQPCVWEGA